MKISLICSNPTHPVNAYLDTWITLNKDHHDIALVRRKSELPGGDILFLISCSKIITESDRAAYRACLVLHASDLPHGRGWSPYIWEIMNGAEYITLSLFEAEDAIDSGRIWKKITIPIPEYALWDEINDRLFKAEIELINYAVDNYGSIIPEAQSNEVIPTYYRRRTPEDSIINPQLSLASQFDHIRSVTHSAFLHSSTCVVIATNCFSRKWMMNQITIEGRNIGPAYAPYVTAEMSANHNGNLDTALRIIQEAKQAGADAIKIQTYRPDTITLNSDLPDFQITDGLWAGRTLYDLYELAHTPWNWHAPLFEHARKLGITIFSSPFDNTAVDLLEDLNAPAYKIASFEAVDLPLIKYVASTRKPMIISTGMADAEEIQEAIDAAREGGCMQLAILHCVSGYPAPAADYNLHTIPDMIQRFGLVTGLSDHTLDNTTAIASIALGANIIEKHFTLDRTGGGPDDSFSLEPPELADLCKGVRTAWDALGKVDYRRKSSEEENVKFRRSLYFVKDLKAREVITADAVRSVRPGYGLAPKYLDRVVGRIAARAIRKYTAVSLDDLE